MKITHLDVRVVDLPYKEPIQWVRSREDSAQYALLQICTDEGVVGIAGSIEIKGGKVQLPSGPGIGVELNPAVLKRSAEVN